MRFTDGATSTEREETARQMLYRLIGEDRFLVEIFTTYAGAHFEGVKQTFNISDVVLHNDDEQGYWIIVSGRVYDMNVFNYMHPGGAKIIQSYSGMDATIAYQKADTDETSTRDIEPFALLSTQENWLLIAWCRLRKEFRYFRLDRIESLEIIPENFTPHKMTLQEFFDKHP